MITKNPGPVAAPGIFLFWLTKTKPAQAEGRVSAPETRKSENQQSENQIIRKSTIRKSTIRQLNNPKIFNPDLS